MLSKHNLWWVSYVLVKYAAYMPLRKGEAGMYFFKLCTLAVWCSDPAHLECKLIYTEPRIGLKMESKGNEPVDEKEVILHTLKRSTAEKRIMGKAKQYW